MEQIIYLDADDQMASVRERLGRAQSSRVLLVVPARSLLFRSPINLKLLQRSADQLGVDVALVSGDRTTRSLAREFRIPVRSSLGRRQGAGQPADRPAASPTAEPSTGQPEDGGVAAHPAVSGAGSAPLRIAGATRPRPGLPPRGRPGTLGGISARSMATAGQRILGYILLLCFLATVAAAVLLLAPEATIDLTPASETVTRTIPVKAGTDIRSTDVAKGQIPARLAQVTLQDSAQTDSTGRKQEPAQRATGRVVLTNRSGTAVNVPQGLGVRTGTGTLVRFFTSAPATVEANSSTQVPIIAELPGSVGNVAAWSISQLEGPLSFQLSAVNDTPTSGGNEQQAQLVTAADRVRLRDSLYAKMKDSAAQSIRASLKPGEILLQDNITIRVEDEAFDREIGEVSKSVGLRIRMSASTLVVPSDGLKKLAQEALEAGQRVGAELMPGSVTIGQPLEIQVDGSAATFRFEARATSVVGLDVQQVRQDVVGLSVAQAEALLLKRYRLNRDPDITLRNGWLGRLPLLGFRIQVVLSRT